MNQRLYRNVGIGVAILAAISLLLFTAELDEATPSEITFSDFLARIEDQQVEEVTIEEGQIHGRLADGGARLRASRWRVPVPRGTRARLPRFQRKRLGL